MSPKHEPEETELPNSVEHIHTLSPSDVFNLLCTSSSGLSADETARRRQQYGSNSIRILHGTPLWQKFLSNFIHPMALLLWAGGIIAVIGQMPELGIAIWMVNLINGIFSFWQEYKAERSVQALQRLIPEYVRVLRQGREQRIQAVELVPGDILVLEEGENITADARLIEADNVQMDESALTGESHTIRKQCRELPAATPSTMHHANLIYAGTTVLSGAGKAVVYATGMQTQFGRIAHATQSVADELSPLQIEMKRVTRIVTQLALAIGIGFFLLAVLFARVNLTVSFVFALGMIVAFVPEGMLPTVTLALAMGVQRMARRHALVKKLSAVETLGCTTVICTDKTGTLTHNEMTVTHIWTPDEEYTVSGTGYTPSGHIELHGQPLPEQKPDLLIDLLIGSILCTNADLNPPPPRQHRWQILGDPTEGALLVAGGKAGLKKEDLLKKFPFVHELPFSAERKRMTTIHQTGGEQVAFVKGAPAETLVCCTHMKTKKSIEVLSESKREHVLQIFDRYARRGLRVLAVASRVLNVSTKLTETNVEQDLVFHGLIAMIDPPRSEVIPAIEKCHRAGIRIIMLTGDYGLTAESIAHRIGMIRKGPARVITGAETSNLNDQELTEILMRQEVIFARVNPEDKMRVVNLLKQMGHVVAVTGDGVNDAPALKSAHIGIAMGITGTDVAKEAADMILTDDNFASIVSAVEEGRAIFSNIRKFATYVFNSNMAEAVPFVLMLFSRGRIPLPLTIMQVLAIDLGTDMVPAIALGTEPPQKQAMDEPPRSLQEPLLKKAILVKALLWYGMLESVAGISAYFFLNWLHGWPGNPLASEGTLVYRLATTMTLSAIVFGQVGAVFACRTDTSSIRNIGFFSNPMIIFGIVTEILLLLVLMYVPWLQRTFNTAPLGWPAFLFVIIWAPVILGLDEIRKRILRRRLKVQTR